MKWLQLSVLFTCAADMSLLSAPANFLRASALIAIGAWSCVLPALAANKPTSAEQPAKDEFSRLVKMEPFVVRGEQLSVSIHARSGRDRSYALGFAEEVISILHESGVTDSPGKGLVIIGAKGEPHPIRFFRQFLELAKAGKLDPAVAARGPELQNSIDHWQHRSETGHGKKSGGIVIEKDNKDGVDLEFERIVSALPLPLEGIGAQLYQLAWFEKFDDARVEAKLRALRAADLAQDRFSHYDWVFYLPPRGAFEQVIDDMIAEALKEEGSGFFARMAVKSVMLVVKPKIRKAIEGMRRGLLFDSVARVRTKFDEDAISDLTGAFIEQIVPGEHEGSGSEHERCVRAVRAELKEIREAPAPATAPDAPQASIPAPATTEK